MFLLIISAGMMSMAAPEVSIKGSVINPSQHPVGDVKVYLKSNPAVYCYSDSNGLFQLSSSATSATALVYSERISFNTDGSLQINALQNSLSIDIYDMLGRRVKEIMHRENLNGIYRIHPGAYLNDLPGAIYIARVRVDEYTKGIKVSNLSAVDFPTGLTRIVDYTEPPEQVLKSDAAEDDTLVFSHDFFKQTTLAISSYTEEVGVIQLENFGDYTVAEGLEPDKTLINKHYGNFLKLTSTGDSEFEVYFDSASCFEEELLVKAIPISQLDFLPDSFEFISGIHLEPSGTQFLNPPEAWIKLLGHVSDSLPGHVSDSLVVFGYNDESDEIYYLPYYSYTEGYYGDNPVSYLKICISHFSGIGVAKGMIPDLDQPLTRNLTDHISYLAFKQQQNQEISIDDWSAYYKLFNEPVLKGGTSLESLKQYIFDMMHYLRTLQTLGIGGGRDTEEYADFISEVIKRIKEQYESFNEECTSTKDDCEKFHAAQKVAEALNLGDLLGLTDSLPDFHEFCNQEMVDFRDTIKLDAYYLKVGDTRKLPVTLYNFKKEPLEELIKWESTDPFIADLDQTGLVTGIGEGDVNIKGTWCDAELEIRFNVTEVDCQNEFCKHEECANGIFKGRGTVTIEYSGYNNFWDEVFTTSIYNVFFTINLNPFGGGEIFTTGDYRTKRITRKQITNEITIRHSFDTFSDKDHLSCSNKGFSNITGYPIFIERIKYHDSSIIVKFGRRTENDTFTSVTTCTRTSQ